MKNNFATAVAVKAASKKKSNKPILDEAESLELNEDTPELEDFLSTGGDDELSTDEMEPKSDMLTAEGPRLKRLKAIISNKKS